MSLMFSSNNRFVEFNKARIVKMSTVTWMQRYQSARLRDIKKGAAAVLHIARYIKLDGSDTYPSHVSR